MEFIETRDKVLLRSLFAADPVGHLYQWGDLAPALFDNTRWFAAAAEDQIRALMLLFTGIETPAVLITGDAEAQRGLLEIFAPELPARFYTKLDGKQEELVGGFRTLSGRVALRVMGLDRFHAQPQPPRTLLRRLAANQPLEPVRRLYQDYPGNFFDAVHLRSGVYAGAWVNGRLASIAGTHTFAPEEGVAAIGNIVTGAEHRGKGLCQATTSFLVAELRKAGCRHIGLHVEERNGAAIACYEKLGFRLHSRVSQYLAES